MHAGGSLGRGGKAGNAESDSWRHFFDLSLLKMKEKDLLAETFRSWSRKVPCDMAALWEKRLRKRLEDR